MNKRRLYYSACSLSVLVLSGALAPAAPATNSDPVALETVEVLGSREQAYRATVAPQTNKSDTPLQQIPFSVQVVTRELIADRGALTLGEALRYTPGLAPQVGFSNSNDRFTIRGFTTPFSYTNGFRRSGYSVDTQLANLEQIEILKGSASALYGRAEPSGIVNIVTKKPQRDAFTEISVLAGDFEAFRAAIDTNQPLGDAFGFRLNASFDDRGSYRDLVESQSRFVAPVMSWSPTDATTVSLELEYSELRSFPDRGFGNSALFLQAPRHRQFAGADASLERDGGSVTLSVDHRLSDRFSLRVAGQHSTFEINALIYNAGFPAVTGFPGTAPRVNVVPNDTYDKQRNTTGQVELYARFKTGEWGHQGLLGLEQGEDYWDYLFLRTATVSFDFNNPEVPGPATGPFSVNFGGQEKARASAAYFQNEMARGSWRFLIGGRYDWSEASVYSYGFGAPSFNERS
ncbi:MAG TPA: TonB-dependent receptor plug domain-containing protein, partial [Opitutaceae bacterium]|nr:TonB-dependent receptor plug domain-containing protein [Opitutaceae bacterium]